MAQQSNSTEASAAPAGPAPSGTAWRAMDAAVVIAACAVVALAWRARVIGPRTKWRNPGREVEVQPAVIWLAAAVLAYFFASAVWALASGLCEPLAGPKSTARGAAVPMLIAYAIAAPACLGLARMLWSRAGQAPAWLRLEPRDLWRGGVWLAVVAPVIVTASAAAVMLHGAFAGAPPAPIAHETLVLLTQRRGDPWVWALMIGPVLGAPLVEEVVHRGFVQSGILAATERRWVAITGSSVVFAAVHVGAVPWHALLPLFVLGLCLGLAYERRGSLAVPMAMHALFNAANIAIALGTTRAA